MLNHLQIETARLRMRSFTIADVEALHRHWTHPEVRKYLWDDIIIPHEQVVETVESSINQNKFGEIHATSVIAGSIACHLYQCLRLF